MKRNTELKEKRGEFVKLAVNDKRKASKKLASMAESLRHTKNYSDLFFALSQIFCVSERTILRDLKQ